VAQHFGYLNNIQWIPVHFKIRYDFGNHLNEEENLRLPLPLDFFLPVMLLPGMEVKKKCGFATIHLTQWIVNAQHNKFQ
jgi:hypothetical protein